jgi:biopolymer transport protein ExbD
MAEIIANEGGKQKGKRRSKRHSTHIDMTPMVDLACLLLTFFMLTTAFSKAKVMEIILPEKQIDKTVKAPEINKSRAMNIILVEGDKILWYNGLANPAEPPLPTLNETDYSAEGIRKVILHRNKDLFVKVETMNQAVIKGTLKIPTDTVDARRRKMYTADTKGPIILIKAADKVKYRNIVDIIDEMSICNVARYALVDINDVEKKMVADYMAGKTAGAASLE